MKLYYWPRSRAFRTLWMLEELGEPYELVPVDLRAGAQQADTYRRINPMMKVPALDDDTVLVAESAAILLYLADRYPKASLAPGIGDARRGRFLQWLLFTGACIEPALVERMRGQASSAFGAAWSDFDRVAEALENGLSPGPWILGNSFSAADILLADAVEFASNVKLLPAWPVFAAYQSRAHARPGYQRAQAIEEREAAAIA